MTGLPDSTASHDPNARDFHREQLSAMMDGALSADEAKFLLRRMEHDDALADCWQRWQLLGDALRGQVDRALPADFSRRVGRAIADDIAAAAAIEPRAVAAQANMRGPLSRWGGGAALAASVALAALIGTRMMSVPDGKTSTSASMASAAASTPTPMPMPSAPTPIPALTGVASQPPAQSGSLIAEAGAAVALAAVSRGDRRGSRPRILAREQAIPASSAATAKAIASARPTAVATATHQITGVAGQTEVTSKPWPRALVPGASMNGEVTAGFEGASPLHPFQPQLDPLLPQVAQPVEDTSSPP
ncbi:MAG: sigma-E factor negative regulatory protein [Lysobacteraceae bacterium]